jgi:cytoskeletal protein RodZ
MVPELVTLGGRIRAIREERGVDLQQVSNQLKIPVKFMEQIENGDLIDTISNATTILFIKAYLDFLGGNSANLVLEYKQCFSLIKRNRTLDECVVKLNQAPRSIDLKISIIVTFILLMFSYSFFQNKQNIEDNSLAKEHQVLLSTH